MKNREYMASILMFLSMVLVLSGAAALSMLPRVINIYMGILLFVFATILGFVALEFLPRTERDTMELKRAPGTCCPDPDCDRERVLTMCLQCGVDCRGCPHHPEGYS